MALRIEPASGGMSMQVTGDIETQLAIPCDDAGRFLLGASDGTLLLGRFDEQLRCAWEVAKDGAGIVRVVEDAVVLDWHAEWVTASVYDPNIVEVSAPQPLPLFAHLEQC